MDLRNTFSVTDISFLVAGLYFIAVAALRESSFYSVIAAAFCFIAIGVGFWKGMFLIAPWRVATAALVLVLLAAQVLADSSAATLLNYYEVASITLNGILLIVFIGVLLFTARDLVLREEISEEKEEEASRAVRAELEKQ